jgi:hypothetical protein
MGRRDDLAVRRAMQRKMEYLAASQAAQEPLRSGKGRAVGEG